MKLYTFLFSAIMLLIQVSAFSQARVQIVHNSPDAAAEVVDVWLNDTKLIENFAFRTATSFIDAPAGVLLNIGIAQPNSTSWTQSFSIKQVVLTENETYIIVASGIISTSDYTPAPAFKVSVYPIGREAATQSENTDVLVMHGSTDAPTVDIYETGVGLGEIVDDLAYENYAGYLELPTMNYVLEVRDETGTNTIAAYSAPLSSLGLEGSAITIHASGFLNPDNNSNGPAFGLWVALPTGGPLLELPAFQPVARVQVIHNSADAAAAVVDVWLDNTLLIDDFEFRTATPFIDAPAGVEFTIAILPPNSTSPENPIWSKSYILENNETYILVASGLVVEENYDPFVPFDISVFAQGRESATVNTNTDVLVYHGSTDAPVVDVVEVGVGAGTIVDDLGYAAFAGYLELPTLDFSLQIRNEAGTDVVAQFDAPLETLGLDGEAISVIASGFLNPDNNNDGPGFGLFVALASGGDLIALPQVDITTARVQVIHNSADLAALEVDVWLNDILLIDNFGFRTASPFIDAPAGEEFTIAILPSNSTSPENPIWSNTYTLEGNGKYTLIANGLVVEANYDPFVPFDIYVYPMSREIATSNTNTDLLVFHGSTDAPIVDVVEVGVGAGTIVDNLAYSEFSGYLELPTDDYVLEIRDETGTVTVATYSAPLQTLGLDGASASVIASGFLNPENNSNGASFGLFVVLAGGGDMIPLPVVTSVDESSMNISDFSVYPNPARELVNVRFNVEEASSTNVEIINLLGKVVYNEELGQLNSGNQSKGINVSGLAEGIYLMRVSTPNSSLTSKIKIVK
jgi:hypothetical protein